MPTRFTVAVPTHDRPATALLAVESARRQTRPADRILVLCDGDTAGTAAAVRALGDPAVQAVELPKGPGYAYAHRNVPLDEPDADVVLWLADDDLLLPSHLEQLGAAWDAADPDVVMVTAPAVIVHEDDGLEWLARDWSVPANRRALADTNHCPMAAVSVRAAAARAAGGWTGETPRGGDWQLWKRMLAPPGAGVRMVREPTVLHFRATGRAQAWPDRVAQNTRWLARIGDPAARAALAAAMDRARAEREADDHAQVLALTATLAAKEASFAEQLAALREAFAQAEGYAKTLEADRARLQAAYHALLAERTAGAISPRGGP